MKVALLLAACCLFLCAYASPITTVESAPQNSSPPVANSAEKKPESGRQAPADGTNPAPAVTDDDDDDDDDEDVDLDITDDDDDDDDSDETEDDDDDDDEDYFERFFDDILGDDDDDDDDDTKPPAAAATPAVQSTPQQTPVVQPQVSRPSLTPDYSNLDYTAPGETLTADSGANGDATVYDDITPEEQAAGVINHQDDNIASEAVESALDTTYDNTDIQKPPESVQPVSTSDDDDDDDDDDEDDLDVSLEEDDDDDDDDEEDDDEDDDDDDEDDIEDVVGDDVIEAKRARSLEANTGSGVPPVYIAKYNRFVDNIMERINRILRKNYDPVNVRLHNNNNSNNNNKNNNKSNKKNNKNRRRSPAGSKKNKRPGHHRSAEDYARSTNEPVEVTMNESLAAISAQLAEGAPALSSVSYNATEPTSTTISGMATTELATTKRSENGLISRARPNIHRRKNNNNNKKNKKNKNKGRQRPVARATLYGLSSLRREGDVTVNMMSSHTTVKTKFTVGPLILKVEKEFGRGAKKDIRSATATTTEMTGKLNLRVMHGGAATLHSIRVMQPKQVRVESSDDHDKTREYVWKRSSHIAHVVSQKLTNATKSMLQPPPMQSTSFLG